MKYSLSNLVENRTAGLYKGKCESYLEDITVKDEYLSSNENNKDLEKQFLHIDSVMKILINFVWC